MLSISGRFQTESSEDQHFAEDSQVAVHCQHQVKQILGRANTSLMAGQFEETSEAHLPDRCDFRA